MFVFFNDPATTEIYTLSLPDALPSSRSGGSVLVGASGGVQGEAGVDRLVGPGGADPGVRGVVDDPPGALVPGAGHDVEVVEVVTRGGDRRAVPAAGDEHHVTVANLGQHVDRAVGGAVDPLVGQARLALRPGGDLEVVDLLELALHLARLVVLVRWIGRPVAARGDHLAGDDRVGLEDAGRGEVVDLPAAPAGAAQLDRHVGGRAVAHRQP